MQTCVTLELAQVGVMNNDGCDNKHPPSHGGILMGINGGENEGQRVIDRAHTTINLKHFFREAVVL